MSLGFSSPSFLSSFFLFVYFTRLNLIFTVTDIGILRDSADFSIIPVLVMQYCSGEERTMAFYFSDIYYYLGGTEPRAGPC